MVTQVIFNLDKELKAKALKKAKEQGIPLSAVLKMATKAYVDGSLSIAVLTEKELSSSTIKIIEESSKDIQKNQNLSKTFSSPTEAIDYLESLS